MANCCMSCENLRLKTKILLCIRKSFASVHQLLEGVKQFLKNNKVLSLFSTLF